MKLGPFFNLHYILALYLDMITNIELLMYQVSDLLLAPVLLSILFVFFYGFYVFGQFCMQAVQRNRGAVAFKQQQSQQQPKSIPGYDLHNFLCANPKSTFDELEVFALKDLEFVRLITRIAPMLGLVATMIPMGPALKSLADGNIQGISDNLVIAFAAVIFGLVAATFTFLVASVKKRWLAVELIEAQKRLELTFEKAAETVVAQDHNRNLKAVEQR